MTSGDRAGRGQSLDLTVVEAENPRSTNVVDMGVYGLVLTHSLQNDQTCRNWTKIDEVSLNKCLQIFLVIEFLMQTVQNFVNFCLISMFLVILK